MLKPGGLLILDAPSTAILDAEDIVEEWFIDKHLYHFSARTLMRMVVAAGFDIVTPPDLKDRENLLIVARKTGATRFAIDADPREVAEAQRLLTAYKIKRARNMAALSNAAAEITDMAPRRVAIWGAGAPVRFTDGAWRAGSGRGCAPGRQPSHPACQHAPRHRARSTRSADRRAARRDRDHVARLRGGDRGAGRHALPHAEIVFYSALLTRAHIRKAA